MSEQDKIINRLEGDVELRDQNIAELCEDFMSALTAFRALSQQWKNTEFMLEDGNPYDRVAEAMRQRCKADLDALLVSLSAPTDSSTMNDLALVTALMHAKSALQAAARTFSSRDADHPVCSHIEAALAEIEYLENKAAESLEAPVSLFS